MKNTIKARLQPIPTKGGALRQFLLRWPHSRTGKGFVQETATASNHSDRRGEIPADSALLIRSVLIESFAEDADHHDARSSLQGGSVLVWLLATLG